MKITRHNLRKMIMESMLGRGRMTPEESAMLGRRIDQAMAIIKRELQNFYMGEGIMNPLDQQLSVHYGGMATQHSVVIQVASHEGGPDDQYQIENFRRHLESIGYPHYETDRAYRTEAVTGDPDDMNFYQPQEYFTFNVSMR